MLIIFVLLYKIFMVTVKFEDGGLLGVDNRPVGKGKFGQIAPTPVLCGFSVAV